MPVKQDTKDEAQKLLEEYLAHPDIELRNELVLLYSYIPKVVASQMRGITSSYAEVEDIVNNGMVALIDCIERFDPEKSGNFESYAYSRIKCANIDFVRKQDWLPRRVRKTARDITQAFDELSNRLLRSPTNKELAEHMNVDEETIHKHFGEITNSVLLSFEGLLSGVSDDLAEEQLIDDQFPESALLRREISQRLAEAIDMLTEKERIVISLHYYEHLKLCEIAKVMNVSEARVCQTRAKAVLKMQKYLKDYL